MIIDILLGILLLLGIAWVTLGIAYLWRLFQDSAALSGKNTPKQKAGKPGESPKPSVSQEQIDSARHILVGRSKPFTSQSIPEVPAISPSEKSAENPDTFAGKNAPTRQDITEKEGSTAEEDDNEMDVDYTMDEPDEDTIVREELQIADDSLPEVSPSAILARDIIRVNGWHRNDDALDEEDETDVHETLQTIRGTQLMEYMKEAALGQEQDHQKLLAAIRKVEETELQENDTKMTSAPGTDNENNNEGTTEEKPLSYYL
jgi:hypothetical protein